MRIKSAISFFDPMVLFLARFAATAAAAALVACAAGCASRAPVAEPASTAQASKAPRTPESPTDLVAEPPSEAIVAIHKSKCGSCHTRVEPGSLARATAESAMQRHRRRAKLSEREWEDMVDYLSADHLVHARPTARLP
jgi:hypothetical protein